MPSHREIKEKLQDNTAVAILLPTYCEAENIESLIKKLQQLKLNLTVTVIDDSSPDGTANIVRKLRNEYDNILLHVRSSKLGLGTAITDGFHLLLSQKNKPKYIITMDADYSHNPEDIPRLLKTAKQGSALIIGSRYCKGGKTIGWHKIRLIISRLANILASATIGMWIRDCTSGLRCYSKEYVKTVLPSLHSQTYEIQIETVKQARLQGFEVKEIPITFMNRKRGKSKLTRAELKSFFVYIIKNLFSKATIRLGKEKK
jgi:dolichol-phosphate mannosyltransferase